MNLKKIERVEIINAKVKMTTTKTGKEKLTESGFLFRVRIEGVWYIISSAIKEGYLACNVFARFTGTRSKDKCRILLPDLMELGGMSVPESVKASAKEAEKAEAERENKRTAKRKATWEAGRKEYIKDAKTKADARFDRLEEEFGEAGEE